MVGKLAIVACDGALPVQLVAALPDAVKKRLDAVYDLKYQRAQSQGQGAWLYMREE